MKAIICGPTTYTNYEVVSDFIEAQPGEITEVVCSCEAGVDVLAKQWADSQDPPVPVTLMPVDWRRFGSVARMYNNIQMGDYADTVIAIYDNKCSDTKHMINYALDKGITVAIQYTE